MLRPYQRPCLATGNPLPGDPHDFLNQLVVPVSRGPRGLGKARVHGGVGDDAGERIQLDDVGHTEPVHAHVDPAPVAATECAIGVECHAFGLTAQRVGDTGWRALEDRERMLARVPNPLRFDPYTGGAPGGSVAKSNPTTGRQRTSPLLPRIATVNSGPGRYVSTRTACA